MGFDLLMLYAGQILDRLSSHRLAPRKRGQRLGMWWPWEDVGMGDSTTEADRFSCQKSMVTPKLDMTVPFS